jgi:hypothetical protein
MPHSNHQSLQELAGPIPAHAASLLQKIAAVEAELDELAKRTLVWEDTSKQLKRRKLYLRDRLAALTRQNH